jgi:hypothetical protein
VNEQAIELLIAAARSGLLDAVAERAVDYTDERVRRLMRRRWNPHRCRWLARVARKILDGKEKLHQLIGTAADRALERMGAAPIERVFARKLVETIPIPFVDTKAIAPARALQLVGIYLCLVNDNLPQCACLADLVRSEAKDRLTELIEGAGQDWIGLGQIRPKAPPKVAEPGDAPFPGLHLPPRP